MAVIDKNVSGLDAGIATRILHDNAARLYRIDLEGGLT